LRAKGYRLLFNITLQRWHIRAVEKNFEVVCMEASKSKTVCFGLSNVSLPTLNHTRLSTQVLSLKNSGL